MKQTAALGAAFAVLAFIFPDVALGDYSGTVLLQPNTALNLDAGTTAASGGDILWSGTSLTPQGSAKAHDLGNGGYSGYSLFPQSYWAAFENAASNKPIPDTKLLPGGAFIVVTNAGHLVKLFVASDSGGVLSLLFTVFGAAAPAGVPFISQILNNSSLTPPFLPNYGIAPSSIFIVTGTNLSDPGTPTLQSSAAPGIPLTLNGTSVTVVVNGVTTHPALYYTSPGQIAAVMPAATPVGTGTLTVTYRGAPSTPSPITIVPSAVGINMYGVNSGVATDAKTGALITYTNSASPGQVLTLWTTGLGADAADSDTTYTLSPHRVNTPLQIYVGALQATILYQGASTYPGVNQINLTIPQNAQTGCWVTLIAVTGTVISNPVTLPINKGGGTCVDAANGVSGNQVTPTGGQTIRGGLAALIHSDTASKTGRTLQNSTDAAFEKYEGVYTPSKSVSVGGCIVGPVVAAPVPKVTGLDAGTISLTGPNGLSVTLASQLGIKGAFYSALTADAIPVSGGTYIFTGTGGADVGAFTSTLTLTNPIITLTSSFSSTVDRSQGLDIAWNGGNAGSYVYITGTSRSSDFGVDSGFTCLTTADAGKFTVPSYILEGLPAGVGGIDVQDFVTAPLPASGLDVATAAASVSYASGAVTFK